MASGLANEGFDIDLAKAGLREDAFANVLFKATVEHKSDKRARETGNVFIEFKQKGRDSGIAVTTAQFWAIEFDDDCWIVIPTERLKRIARKAYRANRSRFGGDFDQYEGVVVPLTELLRSPEPCPASTP